MRISYCAVELVASAKESTEYFKLYDCDQKSQFQFLPFSVNEQWIIIFPQVQTILKDTFSLLFRDIYIMILLYILSYNLLCSESANLTERENGIYAFISKTHLKCIL